MDVEAREQQHVPMWLVGHSISDPEVQVDGGLVDDELNAGVSPLLTTLCFTIPELSHHQQ